MDQMQRSCYKRAKTHQQFIEIKKAESTKQRKLVEIASKDTETSKKSAFSKNVFFGQMVCISSGSKQ